MVEVKQYKCILRTESVVLSREHGFVEGGDRKLKVGVELSKDEIQGILQFSKDYKDIFSQCMKDMPYISREITEHRSRVICKLSI